MKYLAVRNVKNKIDMFQNNKLVLMFLVKNVIILLLILIISLNVPIVIIHAWIVLEVLKMIVLNVILKELWLMVNVIYV